MGAPDTHTILNDCHVERGRSGASFESRDLALHSAGRRSAFFDVWGYLNTEARK